MLQTALDIINNNLVALLIGTLVGTELTRYLYKPNVVIFLKELSPLISDNGFFISIKIANKGRTAALKSIGNFSLENLGDNLIAPESLSLDEFERSLPTYRLEDIKLDFPRHQLITPKKQRKIKNNSLCWSALSNPREIDINPGSSEALDICRIQHYITHEQDFWYVIFPSEQGWRKVCCRVKLVPGEPLKGKILICPSNIFPVIRPFKIYQQDESTEPELVVENYPLIKRVYFWFRRDELYFD